MKTLTRLLIAMSVAACWTAQPGAALQQPPEGLRGDYDTSKVITLRGFVTQIDPVGPDASLLLLSRVTDSGTWAVEVDSRAALERAGWRFGPEDRTIPPNTEGVVSAFPLSEGSLALRRVMTLVEMHSPQGIARKVHTNSLRLNRLVYGLELTLLDGRKLPLGSRR